MKFSSPFFLIVLLSAFYDKNLKCAVICKGNIAEKISSQDQNSSADILPGSDTIETFSQPVIHSFTDQFLSKFFLILSAENEKNLPNEFTISKLHKYQKSFIPLCPEAIQVNHLLNQPNPFYNQPPTLYSFAYRAGESDEIDRILLIDQKDNKLWTLYGSSTPALINAINQKTLTNFIPDASGKLAGKATALEGSTGNVFIAVNPHEGKFGDKGSGIAFCVYGDVGGDDNTGQSKVERLYFFDPYDKNPAREEGNRAYSFDRTSTFLHLDTHELTELSSTVMHWSQSTQSLYLGITGIAGNNEQDAICGIAIGKVTEDRKGFNIKNFVNPSAITGGKNQLFAARGAQAKVSIYHINSMFASVWGDYLIVNGGTQTEEKNKRTIFALPLVRADGDDSESTLAAKSAPFQEIFHESTVQFLKKRTLTAQSASDLVEEEDPAALVGSTLTCGPIEQLFIDADTVFISIKNADPGHLPGIFSSQALFTSQGFLKGWTPWKRIHGITDPVHHAFYNPNTATISFVTTNSNNEPTIVKQTTWNTVQDDKKNLYSLISEQFPLSKHGVHAATCYDHHTPGVGENSFMVLSGYNKVGLVQTTKKDKNTNEQVTIQEDEYLNFQEYTHSQKPTINTRALIFSTPYLDTLGPISTHAIGTNNSHAWLFVASYKGIAILSNHDDSCGWDAQEGIGDCFVNLMRSKMSFKKFSDLKRIKKLYADNHYLYVLTEKSLERIDLIEWHKTNQCNPTTIACIEQIPGLDSYGCFFDLIISNAFACLGTSKGLYRIADNLDARQISIGNNNNWIEVETPERVGAILHLSVTSHTGRPQDISKFNGGHIYAVGAYRGKNQAVLYRYSYNATNQIINKDTLSLFPDSFIVNSPSYFCNFGSCVNQFITDGSQYLSVPIQSKNGLPIINGLPSLLIGMLSMYSVNVKRSGYRSLGIKGIPLFTGSSGTIINSIFKEMNSGRWFAVGDFGLCIHE